jgi:hypothetical protein
MKNAKGQEVRWVTEEDFFAYAKEKLSPEKYAEMEARHKAMRERHKAQTTKVVGGATFTSTCHMVIPAEMITDPWTGQPKVFTEQERAEYNLTNRGWSRESREHIASFECKICHRLFREHSAQEFGDCMAPRGRIRLFPRGKRAAKKEDLSNSKCEICGRRFGDHSQQEYDGCINQLMKRNKRKKEDWAYVECELCGRLFGDHSSQEYDACVDQIIDNSPFDR